jgi:hypothetical protein
VNRLHIGDARHALGRGSRRNDTGNGDCSQKQKHRGASNRIDKPFAPQPRIASVTPSQAVSVTCPRCASSSQSCGSIFRLKITTAVKPGMGTIPAFYGGPVPNGSKRFKAPPERVKSAMLG